MLDSTQIFDGTLGPTTGIAITTTRTSTNVLDLLVGRDVGAIGEGPDLELHVDVTVAFTTTNSATLQIDFEVCDTAGGSYLPLVYSPVIPAAQLIIGAPIFRYTVPVNQILNGTAGILKTPGRYIQLNYTVAGSTFGAGKVFAYLSAERNVYSTYPNNYTAAYTAGEI